MNHLFAEQFFYLFLFNHVYIILYFFWESILFILYWQRLIQEYLLSEDWKMSISSLSKNKFLSRIKIKYRTTFFVYEFFFKNENVALELIYLMLSKPKMIIRRVVLRPKICSKTSILQGIKWTCVHPQAINIFCWGGLDVDCRSNSCP